MEIFIPNILTKAESYALKALSEGVASENQQKMILPAIYAKICGVQDLAFDPTNQYLTAFSQGKRAASITIIKAIQFDWDKHEKSKRTTKPNSLTTK